MVSGVRRGLFRLGAAAGIAGPAAFTGAWIASSLRHMLLNAPGGPGASWHSTAHDVISGLVYVSVVIAQLALARRFGRDPAWRSWRPWLLASTAATGLLLAPSPPSRRVWYVVAAWLERPRAQRRPSVGPPSGSIRQTAAGRRGRTSW